MSANSEPRPGPRELLGPLHSNEIVIGLALGSPRENPLPPLPREDCADYYLPPHQKQDLNYTDAVPFPLQTSQPSHSGGTSESTGGLKRSGSRWKGLGGLFGKKTPSAPAFDGQPFYMLDRTNQQEWAKPKRTPESPEELSAPNLRRRANTNEESTSKTLRSAEPAHQSGPKAMLRRASTRRKGMRKRRIEETRANRPRAHTGPTLESHREASAERQLGDQKSQKTVDAQGGSSSSWVRIDEHGAVRNHDDTPLFQQTENDGSLKKQAGASSLLQVEIPNVELERYSVMFGDLLSPPTSQSQPSIAFRRQSCSPRRKSQLFESRLAATGKENLHKSPLASNPPRPIHGRTHSSSSTVSKSSTKSTATFSLFPPPAAPQKRNTAHKPLPKPSPLSRSVTAPHTAALPPRPTITTTKSQDPTHVTILVHEANSASPPKASPPGDGSLHQRTPSLDPSFISAKSNQLGFFEGQDHFSEKVYSNCTSSTLDGESQEVLEKRAFPVRKSSMKVPRAPLRAHKTPKAPFALEATDAVSGKEELVSVSVARQVSISRRQRNLVPIVPQVARQAKLVNSCSTPQLRKSHHLTLENV